MISRVTPTCARRPPAYIVYVISSDVDVQVVQTMMRNARTAAWIASHRVGQHRALGLSNSATNA